MMWRSSLPQVRLTLTHCNKQDWLGLRDRWAKETWQAIEKDGQPSLQAPLASFVEAIQKEHIFGDWGFVVFRTIYANDGEWTQFRKRWDQLNQGELSPEYGEGITDDIKKRLKFKWVEDEAALADADPERVRRYPCSCTIAPY